MWVRSGGEAVELARKATPSLQTHSSGRSVSLDMTIFLLRTYKFTMIPRKISAVPFVSFVSLKVRIFCMTEGPRQPVFMVFLAAMQGFYWFLLQ